jgi:hypothetical protein
MYPDIVFNYFIDEYFSILLIFAQEDHAYGRTRVRRQPVSDAFRAHPYAGSTRVS